MSMFAHLRPPPREAIYAFFTEHTNLMNGFLDKINREVFDGKGDLTASENGITLSLENVTGIRIMPGSKIFVKPHSINTITISARRVIYNYESEWWHVDPRKETDLVSALEKAIRFVINSS